ncbi:MAG: hypothetical protein Q4G33_15460 [bacterium]|nr:hypothetical protein [bacterium]
MNDINKAIKYFRAVRLDVLTNWESFIGINRTADINIAIEALEKQLPKKPEYEADGYDDNGQLLYDTAYCPNCRHEFEVDYDATDYCPNCGQALDWSDE